MRWLRLSAWHRPLALLVMLPLLAWALTGLLHPVMSRWQPSAAAMKPPSVLLNPPAGTLWRDLPPPGKVLPAGAFREARALTWEGQPYWLLQPLSGPLRVVHARTGEDAHLLPALVTTLARHYTGAGEPVLSLREVTRFDDEYPFVNRYLPVWRVAFARDDGLVAFIEPRSLQLAGLTNTWKTRFSWLFSRVHAWKWWGHEPSRDAVMTLLLTVILLLVLSGLRRAWITRSTLSAAARWHRWLGWTIAAALMAWSASGLYHLLHLDKSRPAFRTYPLAHVLDRSQLLTPPPADIPAGARLQLQATRLGPLWRWTMISRSTAHAGMSHHAGSSARLSEGMFLARTGVPIMPTEHIRELVADVAGDAHWLSCEPVTAFNHEYGFVNKRLPVYRLALDTPDHLAIYVDPADVAIAAVVRDGDRMEGLSFAYLHKATWLEPFGKNVRDGLLFLCAALVVLAAWLGGRLWLKSRLSI